MEKCDKKIGVSSRRDHTSRRGKCISRKNAIPLTREETQSEGEHDQERDTFMCKDITTMKRTASICGRGYYRWRKQLWDNVNDHLVRRDIPGLNRVYDIHFETWMTSQRPDFAFITLCRQGLSVAFNAGIPEALQLMKIAQRKLRTVPEFENKVFVEAGICSISAMLYVDKGKVGRGLEWIEKAQYLLTGAESSEFTAELNYVLAKYYLYLSSVMRPSKEMLLAKAVNCAQTSRDICMKDWTKGEWYALFAVESLFLVLRIRLDAESFPDDSMTFHDICKGEPWLERDLIDLQKLCQVVEKECRLLKYDYPYVKMGLAKCRCILGIRWMQLYGHKALFQLAMVSCKKARKIAADCNEKLSAYLNNARGCVMSKYVHRTQNQFQRISDILSHCYHALKARLIGGTDTADRDLLLHNDVKKDGDRVSNESSEESKDILKVVQCLSKVGPVSLSAGSERY